MLSAAECWSIIFRSIRDYSESHSYRQQTVTLALATLRHYTTPRHNSGEHREMTSQLVAAKSTKTYNIMRILPFLRHEFSQYGSILPGCCYLLYFFCICSWHWLNFCVIATFVWFPSRLNSSDVIYDRSPTHLRSSQTTKHHNNRVQQQRKTSSNLSVQIQVWMACFSTLTSTSSSNSIYNKFC